MPNQPRPGHVPREKPDPATRGPALRSPHSLRRPKARKPRGTGTPQAVTPGKIRERLVQAQLAAERAERRIERAVIDGRQLGMSWAEIGSAIGMTGQGAGKKFGAKDGVPRPRAGEENC